MEKLQCKNSIFRTRSLRFPLVDELLNKKQCRRVTKIKLKVKIKTEKKNKYKDKITLETCLTITLLQ